MTHSTVFFYYRHCRRCALLSQRSKEIYIKSKECEERPLELIVLPDQSNGAQKDQIATVIPGHVKHLEWLEECGPGMRREPLS